ncbi:MAG TPA: OmpA family protein [Terriglobales bacterium]|nr:OmpA family protein [Terriglobales bacterium]
MNGRIKLFAPLVIISLLLFAGCNKKAAKVVPPAPPSPSAPTATLAANPTVIEQGQSAELTWHTTNASNITIAGLGEVGASGSQTVTPSTSSTYTLTARGNGGSEEATARVTVNPVSAKSAASALSDRDLFNQIAKDIYFDFNQSSLRTDDSSRAQSDGSFLAQHPDLKVVIEGHCDDRGSEVYNLALGDSRANSLKTTLLAQGVSADRIKTISYGKEHPFCTDDNENCWQQNRRDHLELQQ